MWGHLIKVTAVRNGGFILPQIRKNDHPEEEEEEVGGFIHQLPSLIGMVVPGGASFIFLGYACTWVYSASKVSKEIQKQNAERAGLEMGPCKCKLSLDLQGTVQLGYS